MKTQYSDFIGEVLEVEITPYQYSNPEMALRKELFKRIKKELSYSNGLICAFIDVKTTIDKKIIVSGIVSKCQVDC